MTRDRKQTHLKLLSSLKDSAPETAIALMAELEEIQGINDDLIESITKQNEAIENVIIRLIRGYC